MAISGRRYSSDGRHEAIGSPGDDQEPEVYEVFPDDRAADFVETDFERSARSGGW